jgi:hypothetical protein
MAATECPSATRRVHTIQHECDKLTTRHQKQGRTNSTLGNDYSVSRRKVKLHYINQHVSKQLTAVAMPIGLVLSSRNGCFWALVLGAHSFCQWVPPGTHWTNELEASISVRCW